MKIKKIVLGLGLVLIAFFSNLIADKHKIYLSGGLDYYTFNETTKIIPANELNNGFIFNGEIQYAIMDNWLIGLEIGRLGEGVNYTQNSTFFSLNYSYKVDSQQWAYPIYINNRYIFNPQDQWQLILGLGIGFIQGGRAITATGIDFLEGIDSKGNFQGNGITWKLFFENNYKLTDNWLISGGIGYREAIVSNLYYYDNSYDKSPTITEYKSNGTHIDGRMDFSGFYANLGLKYGF